MKKLILKGKPKAPATRSMDRRIGQGFVFVRDNHDWHCQEVSVIAIKGKRFTVARCADICTALLAPQGSPKRKLKTWTVTSDELL